MMFALQSMRFVLGFVAGWALGYALGLIIPLLIIIAAVWLGWLLWNLDAPSCGGSCDQGRKACDCSKQKE